MNCNYKTMIKLAIGIGTTLAIAYFALPGAQALILASAPLLAVLICPLAMLVMMKGMGGGAKDEVATPGETKARADVHNAAPGKP